MALKSALILTAAFGEGHNAAARNLAAALGEKGVAVEVHDLFAEAYGPAIESGAGELATTPAAIADAVRRTFADGGRIYRERLAATGPLFHPDAARTDAAFLESPA